MESSILSQFYSDITIIDTETTGIRPEDSEIIELATANYKLYENKWKSWSRLFGTTNPIPPESSAVHHISNKMVSGKDTFKTGMEIMAIHNHPNLINGQPYDFFTGSTKFFVAHKAIFDLSMIKYHINDMEDTNLRKLLSKDHWICTWRLVRKFYPGIKQTNLSYLRYYFDLDSKLEDNLSAHRAGDDVIVTGLLVDHILEKLLSEGHIDPQQPYAPQLHQLCWDPILYLTFPFGKHKDKPLVDIPTDYYIWALDNVDSLNEQHVDFDSDLYESVKQELTSRIK